MQRKKIDLDAVRAYLDIVCRKCGYKITPDKIQRVDSERVKCPA
jgi:predicted Zn-ribbon and HTH transcriptional regulator